jgi:uncharacterized protein (TIGR00297 family)
VPVPAFLEQLAPGLAVNLVLAAAAYALRAVDRGGALAGAALGAVVWICGGIPSFLLLAAFVALGTLATWIGWTRKARAGIAEAAGGRRGATHVLAKVSVPALAALAGAASGAPAAFRLALAGALATAAADTVSSEIGKAWGRRTFLVTTLRAVPAGTDGAISGPGTLAGLATALALGALGAALGLYPAPGALAVAAAAVVANALESLAGATLERRGRLGHDALNFLASLAGALLAAAPALLP